MTSPGNRLKAARLALNLSVEEVSHATKMRPDRIRDLEADDYAHFPSIAYAKAFLANYARFLKLDLSETLDTFNTTTPIGVEDYEYLSGITSEIPGREPKKQRRIPVLLLVLAAFALGAGVTWYFAVTFERLGDLDRLADRSAAQTTDTQTPPPTPTPPPSPTPAATPEPAPSLEPIPSPEPAEPPRALPATPLDPAATAAPAPNIELRPLRKTWVKVTAGGDSGPTVFEDWLYPDASPLRLGGTRYHIQLSDPAGVLIFNRGEPVSYIPPGTTVE